MVDPAEVADIQEAKLQEAKEKHQSPWVIESVAKHEVRRELARRAPFMTIEEFAARRRQGTGLTVELATEATSLPADQLQTSPPDDLLLDQISQTAAASVPPPAEEEGTAATELPAAAATNPAIADPAALLVMYPPPPKLRPDSPESHLA
jgi:hypothetical protein